MTKRKDSNLKDLHRAKRQIIKKLQLIEDGKKWIDVSKDGKSLNLEIIGEVSKLLGVFVGAVSEKAFDEYEKAIGIANQAIEELGRELKELEQEDE